VAGDDNSRYFSAALTLAISLLTLANLVVFPSLVRLRHTHPDRPRAFRVSGGGGGAGALAAGALATGWSALALAAALWPGLGTADPDAHLPDGFAGQRLAFTLTELVPLAAVLAAAALLVRARPAPAPFARAAQEFLGRGDAHFSIPGRAAAVCRPRNPALVEHPALLADMPHLCGVDDIRASRDLLGQAERLAARAWRADRTWFSVSGSTMANQAMCLAVAAPATGWSWPGPPTARSWPAWCWPGSTRSGSHPTSTRPPGWPWPSRRSGSSAPSATTPRPRR